MGRPFFMPAGTPKPYVEAMRKAFDATLKDPAFLAEAEKVRLEVDPLTGAQMEKLLKSAYETPKPLADQASKLRGE
jgi:tripartite-type tricarboxylate transporter receptor subunit TctC